MRPTPASLPTPPRFLELVAHPIRWRLMSALAESDLRVRELCRALGLAQPRVSYHLALLRRVGLVFARRSSADSRETYYALQLDRCGALLAESGAALHPALQLTRAPSTTASSARPARVPMRVLFLCTGNSARSQIAQALLEDRSAGLLEVRSAGSHPKPLHPNALSVLQARGIDIAGASSKHLEQFRGEHFQYVVSLCDRVREVCPEFPGHPRMIHWSIPDPSLQGATEAAVALAFERTTIELEGRIGFLIGLIEREQAAGDAL